MLLDVDNPSYMWTLQFVYLPRTNQALEIFKDVWNVHAISIEHNQSPNKLWILGMDKDIYQYFTDVRFSLTVKKITVDD